MSWFRQIKTLYAATYLLLLFIIWTLLSSMFLANKLSFNNYLITLGAIYLMEYLYSKEYKKHITLTIPLILGGIGLWTIQSIYLAILNYLFLLVCLILIYRDENSQINYDEYKRKWVSGAYLILPIILFSLLYSPQLLKPLFRLFVMYFILIVVSLRESLRYNYNIRSKYSKYINLGIVFFTVVIFQDYSYKLFYMIMSKIFGGINLILEYTLTAIVKLLGYPIIYGAAFLRKLFANTKFDTSKLFKFEGLIPPDVKNIFEAGTFRDDASVIIVMTILKIMLAIAIFIIVIRTLAVLGKVEKREFGYVEFREKLENNQKKKSGLIAKALRNILRRKGTVKEEILYNYSEFERVTEKVEIFKPYMTASQLKNVTKIKVDNVENLDAMTRIYNEAKFSTHEVNVEDLQIVKESVNNIKSQLK